MKLIYIFSFCTLLVFTEAGFTSKALAQELDSTESGSSQSIGEYAHYDVLQRLGLKRPDVPLDELADREAPLNPRSPLNLAGANPFAGKGKVLHSSDPIAAKSVLQARISYPEGIEVRPEIGKFSSRDFDLYNRKYVGVTGTINQPLDSSSSFLVSMNLGRVAHGDGNDRGSGTVKSLGGEYHKTLGEHFHIRLEAVYQGLDKRTAARPVFKGASEEARFGAYAETAF